MKKLKIDLYDVEFSVYTGPTELSKAQKRIKRLYGTPSNDTVNELDEIHGFVAGLVVYIQDKKDIRTVLHEAHHMVCRIVEASHIEGEEAVAFLNEYVSYKMLKLMEII